MTSGNRSLGQPPNPWLSSWDMLQLPPLLLRHPDLPPFTFYPTPMPHRKVMRDLGHPGMLQEYQIAEHTALDPSHNPRFLKGPGPTLSHHISAQWFHLLLLGELPLLLSISPD